jgi:hypothetical protein
MVHDNDNEIDVVSVIDAIDENSIDNPAIKVHLKLADASGYLYRFLDIYRPTMMMRFRCVHYNQQQPGFFRKLNFVFFSVFLN